MLTVRGKLESMLVSMGMSETQAKQVLDLAIIKMDKIIDDYNINWNDCSSAFPDVIYNVLFMTVKVTALEWIKNNKPQAWFRPIFESK